MKELQGQSTHLRRENDQLRAQIEKSRDLGKDVQDSDHDAQPIANDKRKGTVDPDDVDTPTNDELSSSNSPSLNLSLAKNTRESIRTRSHKRPSPHPTFSDDVSGASRKARREASKRQYQPSQASGNPPMLPLSTLPPAPPAHPTFGTAPIFFVLSASLIWRPDDMFSSPLGQHILDYKPPHEFFIPAFTTFDGSTNPYDHMLHYNQAMTLNASNYRLLCKVF